MVGTVYHEHTNRRANESATVINKGANNYKQGYQMKESDRMPDELWYQLSREERLEVFKRRRESNPRAGENSAKNTQDKLVRNCNQGFQRAGKSVKNVLRDSIPDDKWKQLSNGERDKIKRKRRQMSSRTGEYSMRNSHSREVEKHEKTSEQEPSTETLSDDAFTAAYDDLLWWSLPERVREEVLRQRKLKEERAKNQSFATSTNA